MAAQLTLHDVSLQFGGIKVLQEVSFTVEPGQIFGLVGPNGAGKTSLFNCISGHYKPSAGSIRIDDAEVRGARPATLARHGLARTFQHPALQLHATVLENVLLGAHTRLPGGPAAWSLRLPNTIRSERALRTEAIDLLERNGLGWAAALPADELSHGLHKGIELCRALLMRPKLLLLDEPAAGLPHSEVEQLITTVRRLRAEDDITVVIVEHHMGLIAALTDRVVVLDHGRKLMEGTAAEAQSDPRVIEAYIGKDAADDAAELTDVTAFYGPVQVLEGVSLSVPDGGAVGILGANGAGKTTTLRAISGTVRAEGSIVFDGKDIRGLRPDQVASLGIAHVPEGRGTLGDLTVRENLRVGAYKRKDRKAIQTDIDYCLELFPQLKERIRSNGSALSGGEQQMLAVARAYMAKPRLLLLDEASLGLAPSTAKNVYEAIGRLRRESGIAMVIVEQNANLAFTLVESATVLETGRNVITGSTAELKGMDEVRRAYLGG